MKSVYKLKEHYSVFHKWLNQEGLGTQDVADMLNYHIPTTRNYLKNPEKLKVSDLIIISNELEVDFNFIIDIIKQKL